MLAAVLADGEIEYLRASLPMDYAWLFGDTPTTMTTEKPDTRSVVGGAGKLAGSTTS